MMKIDIAICGLVLLVSLTAQAQEIKSLDKKWYADRIQVKAEDLQPFQVDPNGDYEVTNEGAEYSEYGQRSITCSDLIVNNDSLAMIINTEAYNHGDTLDILVYNEIDASHDHNFQIQIIRDKCFVYYDFSYPMDDGNRKLETVKFKLILDKKVFKIGTRLRGHVEYLGKCSNYCGDYLKGVEVRGEFVVTIK